MKQHGVIMWAAPYGGMRIRGKAPERAHDRALELIRRFTTRRGFGMAQLSVYVWPTRKLLGWARSQPPWTPLPMARAVSGVAAPHPALLPAMERYGEPTCHIHESDGRGDYLRLEWQIEAGDAPFDTWSREWLALAVRYHDDPPFEDDLPSVSASFHFPDGALLTVPDSDEPLPHQAEADAPDGYRPSLAGFAAVPGGALLLTLVLPWGEAVDEFVAYDNALVATLGKIPDTRYRAISARGRARKLGWKR